MGYDFDIQLELKFDRMIKAILGNVFIGKDAQMDRQQATDFLIYSVKPFKVAVRLRRYNYFLKYSDEFTIRYSRPSGVDTEIHKIQKGLVNYVLYGFVNAEETKIIRWFIGDLNVFRNANPLPVIKSNNPPDSSFAIYKLNQFPKNFIVKTWQRNIADKVFDRFEKALFTFAIAWGTAGLIFNVWRMCQ